MWQVGLVSSAVILSEEIGHKQTHRLQFFLELANSEVPTIRILASSHLCIGQVCAIFMALTPDLGPLSLIGGEQLVWVLLSQA